jgi:5-methylcytosine-specific restriction endonuclease McrA
MAGVAVAAVPDEVLWRVYLRDGGCCVYCGRVLRPEEVRLDHDHHGRAWSEVPEEALAVACAGCHEDKGARTRAAYRAWRRLRHAHEVLAALRGV